MGQATERTHEGPQIFTDSTFEGLPIALAEITPTGATLRVNRAMRALLGIAHNNAAPDNLCGFLPPESGQILKLTVTRVLQGHECTEDTELALPDKRRLPVRLLFSPYPIEHPQGALVVAIPLEPYREAARAADSRHIEARRLESLGMLAGGIAHDFNNLLVGIVGGLGLIENDLPEKCHAREHLALVAQTAQRISLLTQQMLAFSGHGHITMEGMDLAAIVREEENQLALIARQQNSTLQVTGALDLPLIQGDRVQLAKVLHGLVSNAAEAMKPSGGQITIRTRVVAMRQEELSKLLPPEPRIDGEYVLLEVIDEGPGVPVADRRKIFDPFYTTHAAGRGLGLAATLGIVRGHRGFITVDSNPECRAGALFRIGFPARTEGTTSTLLEEHTADEVTPGTGIILIVDDEDMVRHVTRTILMRSGYQVLEARDGIEAIEVVEANAARVSLVLLDLNMPRMGGREAYTEIRARQPHLPIILMSGYPEAEACDGFRRRDLAGFIAKPFRAEFLRKTINEIIPPTH